jgi:hypothetical protein
MEQGTCVKDCIKPGKIVTKIHRMYCEAYGDEALNKAITYKWHTFFKSKRTPDNDVMQTMINSSLIAQVKDIIYQNHRLTAYKVAEERNIHWVMSCNFNRRFRDSLGVSKITAKA